MAANLQMYAFVFFIELLHCAHWLRTSRGRRVAIATADTRMNSGCSPFSFAVHAANIHAATRLCAQSQRSRPSSTQCRGTVTNQTHTHHTLIYYMHAWSSHARVHSPFACQHSGRWGFASIQNTQSGRLYHTIKVSLRSLLMLLSSLSCEDTVFVE